MKEISTIILPSDITLFYKKATSFPEGVLEAHQSLHRLVPYDSSRNYFGISRPENGKITYLAGAEELVHGELQSHSLDCFVIKSGKYISITITNFMDDIPSIGNAFSKLLSHTDIDPNGYCIEQYINDKDVICMVKINS